MIFIRRCVMAASSVLILLGAAQADTIGQAAC